MAHAYLLGIHGIGTFIGTPTWQDRGYCCMTLSTCRSRMGSLCLVFVSVVWLLSFGCGCWTPPFGPLFVVPSQPGVSA